MLILSPAELSGGRAVCSSVLEHGKVYSCLISLPADRRARTPVLWGAVLLRARTRAWTNPALLQSRHVISPKPWLSLWRCPSLLFRGAGLPRLRLVFVNAALWLQWVSSSASCFYMALFGPCCSSGAGLHSQSESLLERAACRDGQFPTDHASAWKT